MPIKNLLDISEMGKRLPIIAEQALGIALEKGVAVSIRLVPVDKGHLRDSITSVQKGLKGKMIAGDEEVKYAKFVEFGTSKMHARPFMRPGFAKAKKELPKQISRLIIKDLKKFM
jgi:HK97 gp10 family phage protein